MESWLALTLLAATLTAIVLPPLVLVGACSLGLRLLDDRGLYAVPPLLGLPIAAGGLLEGYLLTGTGLIDGLSPNGIWGADGPWRINLQGLYETYLAPWALADLARLAALDLRARWPAAWPWVAAYAAAFAPVAIIAGFAWRSWRAAPNAALFVPISLTSALIIHYLIIVAYWVVYWLNFWVFFVLVLLLEMRRREPRTRELLAP